MKFLKAVFSLDRVMGMALLLALAAVYVVDPYPVQFLRAKTFDFYQKLRPRPIPPEAQKPVTIIDLDEDSLAEIGQWPWPRTQVAQLVQNLMQMGAGLVAFDIVFAEPDRLNPISVAKTLYGLDAVTKDKILKLPGNDQVLGSVIKKSRVVLGQAGYWEKLEVKKGPPIKKSIAFKGPKPTRFVPQFQSLIRNIPAIEAMAAGHGIFSLVPEPDGIVRRVPTIFGFENNFYPSLAVEIMRVALGRPTILIETNAAGVNAIKLHKLVQLRTDPQGRVWPYFSKSDKSKYVSAKDVMNGTADPKKIKGKLAIVGTSAVGLLDIRSTPVDAVIPGVEVHAQLIETALSGLLSKGTAPSFLTRPNWSNGAELMMLVFGGMLMIWLVPLIGAKWTLGLFMAQAVGSGATSWYMFTEQQMLLDVGYSGISILLLYTMLTYTGYAREEANKKQTRAAFSKYLSPDMVKRVAENPGELKLGGEKRPLTLLFCDVRGFTTISEQFDAVGLTALINKLLTPLTNVILARQGTIDKYMGDCIMAFWNAPLDDARHAYNGCMSALEMLEEIGPLNDRLEIEAKEEGRKHIPLKVGLGLNTGECVVGNMGSDQRFDYSVLGDTVNLAARLEGQSKGYGVNVVLGPTTHDLVPEMATVELDLIMVKGKTVGVHIYALLGKEDMAQNPDFLKWKQVHSEMITAFRAQEWRAAREKMAICRKMAEPFYDMEYYYHMIEDRISDYVENPPPADWDGVYVATSK